MTARYGQIKNGKVTKLFDRKPNWFMDEAKTVPVTEEKLIEIGVYPIVDDLDSFDSRKEIMGNRSKEDLVINEEKKTIGNYFYKMQKSVDSIYDERKREIDGIRKGQLTTDIPYQFPNASYDNLCLDCGKKFDKSGTQCPECESINYQEDTSYIQVRNNDDKNNLFTIGKKALNKVTAGNDEETMYFRDRDNIVHQMTAAQMLEMTNYVADIGQQIFDVSWTHKDAGLKPIFENESLTDEQKIDQILEYDIYANRVIPEEPTFEVDEMEE